MGIYYCFIILLSILSIADSNLGLKKYRQIIAIFFILMLGFFAGFRGDDPDYYNYTQAFIDVRRGYDSISDVGFNVINRFLNYISNDAIIMFLFVALLSTSLNIKAFYKYTPYISVCILLYFVHNFALKEMIQIRAGLACAICLYSIALLYKEQYKRTIMLWAFAMTIHMSSIIWVMVYLLYYFKPSKKVITFAIIISLIVGSIYPFGQIIKSFTNIGDISERVDAYVAYGDSGFAASIGIWTNVNTIKSLIICLGLLIFYDRFSRAFKYFQPLFLAYTVGLCWLLCFNDFAIIGARMSNMAMCSEPILLTYPYILFSKNSKISYTIALIILAIAIFMFNIGPNKITPYESYIL